MTCRMEDGEWFIQTYNAENRIASIAKLESGTCASPGNYVTKWDFAYDGDGTRAATLTTPYESGVPQTAVLTAYYFGGAYEVTGSDVKKYYSFGGQSILRDSTGLQYFLTDHLGSTVAITNDSGTLTSQQRYLPFGGVRQLPGSPAITSTDLGYTGQRQLDMGLMDYKARFYSPMLGRFIQPDSIIPESGNSQVFNRFSYVNNSPVGFNDPSGHDRVDVIKRKMKAYGRLWKLFSKAWNRDGSLPLHLEEKWALERAAQPQGEADGESVTTTNGEGTNGELEEDTAGVLPPIIFGTASSGYSGVPTGNLLQVLGLANYTLAPSSPLTILYFNMIVYEMKFKWLPSVTFNNGSPITLDPHGFGFALGDESLGGSLYISDDSFEFVGNQSSPLVDGLNTATGMSYSTPYVLRPWTASVTVHNSLNLGVVSISNDYIAEFTARPDQVAVAPAVVYAGYLIYRASLGMPPSPQELCLGQC